MAAKSGRDITVNIIGNAKGLQRAATQSEKALEKMRAGWDKWKGRIVAAGVAAGAALAAGTANVVAYAAEAEQSVGAVDAIFKGNADQVHKWASESAKAIGISGHQYR